jgi:hypothetical protein
MTTQNINITSKNINGSCDLKCAYSFAYPESNLTATNEGIMISLTPDGSRQPPVTYNTQKYNVSKIMIVSPSIHMFDSSNSNAEIIIEHSPSTGGNLLSVAIPIVSSSETTEASNFINDIIQAVATNAPSEDETTNLNISGFTLQKIIPMKPFYSYEDDTTDWIVFGKINAIPLNGTILNTLGKIIKPFPLPTPGENLFFNKIGPNNNVKNDGIYISCKPTGSSKEEIPIVYAKNTQSYNFFSSLNSPYFKLIFQLIIGLILFIVTFFMFNHLYTYVTTGKLNLKFPTFQQTPP